MLFVQIYGSYELTFDHLIFIVFSFSLFFLEKATVVRAIIIMIERARCIVSHRSNKCESTGV